MLINTDCLHFLGDIPCQPHKEYRYHCQNCPVYKKIEQNILIIKLGAIGDVIRTTPILRKIKDVYPDSFITWLTYSPEILSKNWVDRILNVNVESIELLKQIDFDWLIVLDKDPIAIALTNQINAKKKSGFTIDEFGRAKPISSRAEEHKWLTGIFDDLSKQNNKHYVQEMFEILDYNFNGEEYILDITEKNNWKINHTKKIIGLNTGCGGRWSSRLWPNEYWIELAKTLLQNEFEVILLGGEQEHEKNLMLSKESGAKYFGYFPLRKFISLVNECDLVVTSVTMAMHIAMGLQKKVIIFNSIFNKNEFYLYGRGEILEPDPNCDCYYKPICPHESMKNIQPNRVIEKIKKVL
ncbi:MAG TPA: glycosyltransferase family 9 protein [Ignavibacteriales bacterium]|nr:glycosyltransferase family 9 protein [Ignavibacteriales bacterium]